MKIAIQAKGHLQENEQTGYALLAGGAEFGGKMAVVDKLAIELAGGVSE